jgi:flavin reductase (DIM6/NTAB) family NADH-FMN oxidoreductase RutF
VRHPDPIFPSMNDAAKQAVLGAFAYGVYALTVKREGEEHGIAVTWVSQASSDPAMVVVAVDSTSPTIELIRDAHHFAVSVLHDGQRDLAEKLGRSGGGGGGGRGSQALKGIRTKPAPISGAPLLADALGWVECRVVATLPSGSHTLVLGEVVEAGLGAGG